MFRPFQAIEDAECVPDPHVRDRLLEAAITFLSAQGDVQSFEVQYAMGYAWYQRCADTKIRSDGVIHHLRNALQINPDHKYALLYLGHHYYDQRQFVEALDIFSKFQDRDFLTLGQAWRDSKVAELVLCCRLQLRDQKNLKEAIHRFCEAMTFCDEQMNPAPKELTETLMGMSSTD
ncbi:hypothetical protein F2P44_30505 [Massilia sp. CCM 8695]|uniref:Tetratricopeptide repeat protein n=1 Tax=Massilia frigida TaxID=2609281 RepID=A0ABX0NDN3_9BURK|nr:hypothetical protein [Massilia frigida]NHZ83567.1 hypothetical protein [Massilia frigida]